MGLPSDRLYGCACPEPGRLRRFLSALALACALTSILHAPQAQGVPVDPDQRVRLQQPSGATFAAEAFGDEWYHGFETPAGYTLVRDSDTGAWVYARETVGGDLVPSVRRPSAAPPAGTDPHARDEDRVQAAESLSEEAVPSGAPLPANQGSQESLVILVEYADQASLGTTPAQWSSRYFGATDSVRDYYDEVSYGDLQIEPAAESHGSADDGVVGWLALGSSHPDLINLSADYVRAQDAVEEAINAADPFVDYGAYDSDGDGSVEAHELHVTVVPAGREASDGNCGGKRVWGHKFGTGLLNTPSVDGVEVGTDYTMFGEKHCSGGDHLATLGIMVHEIGHDLDMPDLYDTDYSSTGGVGNWSVMAYGSWLSLPGHSMGAHPPHPDAFLKSYQGWLTPDAVQGPRRVAVAQAETADAALRIGANPFGVDWAFNGSTGRGEYFLVENRQRVGYDIALPGCGLLVWHVDETRAGNEVDARRLLDLEEADNGSNPFDAADAFTGGQFTQTSAPGSALYSGAASNARMRHLDGACGPSMSAHFSVGAAIQPNDDFAGAHTLTGWLTADRASDSNSGASVQAGEPAVFGPEGSGGASVWYRWTAPSSAPTTITTQGSSFDTMLGVFSGASLGGLAPVASNDDAGGGLLHSSVTFQATEGTTYRIAADGWNGGAGAEEGALQLHLVHDDTKPQAAGESVAVEEEAPALAIDVLANDTDSNGGPKAVESVTDPAHGTAAVSSPGVTYRPAADYCGPDSFTYTLNGGSTATVGVTVACVDDAPVARPDAVSVSWNAPSQMIGVLANDTDVDSGPRLVSGVSPPAHGVAGIAPGGAGVVYQPTAGYCGADQVTYLLNGGSGATVSISIPCPPEPLAPQTRIGGRPKKRTAARAARFTFSSSETGSTFRCRLDSRPEAPCRSPQAYRRLRPGAHVLRVTAVGVAGNADASPATYRWRVTAG